MAINSLYRYAKICPDCNGLPCREVPNTGTTLLWGLIGTPNVTIICARCRGAGKILPKEVILSPSQIAPLKITY